MATSMTIDVQQTHKLQKNNVWRGIALDGALLLVPLALLAGIMYRFRQVGLIKYPDVANKSGDYYRYVNMALPNGDPKMIYQDPFLYRILVPGTVHLLSMVGVPFRSGFFSITMVCLAISTIATYYFVRGIGQGRFAATCAALSFVTLNWAVAYNIHDYFLVDPAAQMFIVLILLAAQRRQYILAILLSVIGVICKESIYLAIVVTAIQLVIPYLRPLKQRLGELAYGRVLAVVQRIPGGVWLRLLALIILPFAATQIEHLFIQPLAPLGLQHVWQHYIGERFKAGVIQGTSTTVSHSTTGTYGLLFAWAVAAVFMGQRWRSSWSGWALLAALFVIIYSYSVSGDSERLAINGWIFIVVLAAVGIEEFSRRTHIAPAILWLVTLAVQIFYEPLTAPNYIHTADLLGPVKPYAAQVAPTLMLLLALLVGLVALVFALQRLAAPPAALAVADPASTTTPSASNAPSMRDVALPVTVKRPRVSLDFLNANLPTDPDGIFWMQARGGLMALNNFDSWIAQRRLQSLQETVLVPLATRYLGNEPQQGRG